MKGSGNKKLISNPPYQECVEEHKEKITTQLNHERYQKHERGTTRCLPGNEEGISHAKILSCPTY